MNTMIRGVVLALALCVGLSMTAEAQAPQLRGFPTPEAAADAVTEAIRKNDDKALTAIVGATRGLPEGMGREARDHPRGSGQGPVRRRHHGLGRADPDRQAGQ